MRREIHGGNIYKYHHKVYDFSANLNPLGMPEEVKQAITDHLEEYESYPDPFNRELIGAISNAHGIPENRICCGNGAADIIFRIALAMKPRKALIVSPTFSEYGEAMEMVGCEIQHYLMKEDENFILSKDIEETIDETLDMMFICNPNNPTGIPIEKDKILSLVEKCKKAEVTMVIDECFSEFLDEEERYSVMEHMEGLENVIILKAFTKIYAMAGLRLGYCICGNPVVADKISNTLQPWSVSTVASKAGVAALGLIGFVEKTKKYIEVNRNYLMEGLVNLGYKTYGAKANYIFFRSEIDLVQPLEAHDIMVRSCANYITLDTHYYRIAVRTRQENEYFLKALTAVTEENEGKTNG